MKIVHICLNCPFTENWGYQENILPRYHKELGNDVTVIATNMTHLVNNSIVETKVGRFLLDDGVQLIRIKKKKCILKKIQDVFSPYDISDLLIELKPNLIMIHGLMGSISTLQVKKYVKKVNKTCKVVVDIHEDYSNSIYKRGIYVRIEVIKIKNLCS